MKKTTVMQTKKKKVFDIRSDIYKVFGQWGAVRCFDGITKPGPLQLLNGD